MARRKLLLVLGGLAPSALFVAHAFYPVDVAISDLLFLTSCLIAIVGAALVAFGRQRHWAMLVLVVAPLVTARLSSPIRLAVVRRVIARGQPLADDLERFQLTHGRTAASIEEASTAPPTTSLPNAPSFQYEAKGGNWRLYVEFPARSGALLEYPAKNCSPRYRYCRDGWGYAEE